jgi:hypothetical protein
MIAQLFCSVLRRERQNLLSISAQNEYAPAHLNIFVPEMLYVRLMTNLLAQGPHLCELAFLL